jgi:hypothetical protein
LNTTLPNPNPPNFSFPKEKTSPILPREISLEGKGFFGVWMVDGSRWILFFKKITYLASYLVR